MSTEEATFSTEVSGLREAAAEVSNARAEGREVSAPQPEPKEAEAPPPVSRRWETPEPESGREKAIVDWSGVEGKISARDAAHALGATRQEERSDVRRISEGDEELARALGEWNTEQGRDPSQPLTAEQAVEWAEKNPEAADQLMAAKERMEAASEDMERTQTAIQAELNLVRADRDAKLAEIEQRKAREAAAAFREQELAKLASQTSNDQVGQTTKAYLEHMAAMYPECITDQGAWHLSQENPQRFAQYRAALEEANTRIKAVAYDAERANAYVAQQQQQGFASYAEQQDATWNAAHPEFQGEKGKRAQARVISEAFEVLGEMGYTREQVIQAYNNDPNLRSAMGQEALTALGRQRLAQKSLQEGKRNPVPKVLRPGVSGDPRRSEYASVSQLDKKLTGSGNVKDAGKLLAAMRRASR